MYGLTFSNPCNIKHLLLQMQTNNDLTPHIIEAITDKKGKKISIIDLSAIETAPTGQLIICQGNSTSQVSSIADSIRERVLEECGVKPQNYDGYRNSQWIIIDFGHIMVHVFLPQYREFYNLESLWNDAPIENLVDLD